MNCDFYNCDIWSELVWCPSCFCRHFPERVKMQMEKNLKKKKSVLSFGRDSGCTGNVTKPITWTDVREGKGPQNFSTLYQNLSAASTVLIPAQMGPVMSNWFLRLVGAH
ncbi:hypothetical protein KIL84_002450 [Mauremys mutica]|uniref:Uncharacterized protein n=1 Tax=Mauremys mutica TaxID=74926 RepID=A0A9D3X6U2_9SAUR|nr:hypothetical protein KIL84_002450 [Mauremys mutica]